MAISGVSDSFDKPYFQASFSEKGVGKNDTNENNAEDLSRIDMQSLVNLLNKESSSYGERITFSYNEKANSIIMRVIDDKTLEVVKEIPPKDAVKLVENIREYVGVLIDETR
jgi:flagellar protein FlaG